MTHSTNDPIFIDTNILIYVRDARSAEKRAVARHWLAAVSGAGRACTNLQVLDELTRSILKKEPDRSLAEVQAEVESIAAWGARTVDLDDTERAWSVRERHGYQWFDCLLVASAFNAGCRYFLTEDMAHGATFEGLTLVNPFRASLDDVLKRT